MYKLKQTPTNLTDRHISNTIFVQGGIVYVENYMFKDGEWYIRAGNNYVNLQGGIPSFTTNDNIDAGLFEPVLQEGAN